jgi:ArsR family transcriptional regulator, arsenate/arsenite/antimonite-responsive transcriptional repressor
MAKNESDPMNKPTSPFIEIQARAEDQCNPRHMPELELRFDEMQAEQFATIFKALSHPVRLQILDLISQGGGEVCVCDIESHFALKQPTLSHHIKVLREAGLIQSEQNRVWIFHRINPTTLESVHSLLSQLLSTPSKEDVA